MLAVAVKSSLAVPSPASADPGGNLGNQGSPFSAKSHGDSPVRTPTPNRGARSPHPPSAVAKQIIIIIYAAETRADGSQNSSPATSFSRASAVDPIRQLNPYKYEHSSISPKLLERQEATDSVCSTAYKLFRNCFSSLAVTARVRRHLMITMIHALWEFSPFIAGLVCGLPTFIRNRPHQTALIIQGGLAMGTIFAFAAGELAGTSLTAVVSIIVDSGAVGAGLIVADVVVKRFAVLRPRLQGP